MPKLRTFQTNFSGGLLSEGMLGRVDLAQYENGCKQLENWWPKVTGGVRRRPGSKYLNTLGVTPTGQARLEPFIFSEDQGYLVVLEPGGWNVYDLDGTAVDNGSLSLLLWSDVQECSVTQKGDVMFIAHRDYKTQKLTRTSASTFAISDFEFEQGPGSGNQPIYQPFVKFADAEAEMSVNGYAKGATVQITLTKGGSPYGFFQINHIGTRIRYRGKQIQITNIPLPGINQSTATGVIVEELDRGQIITFSGGGFRNPNDFEVDEIIVGRDSGAKAIVISTTSNTATVATIAGRFASSTSEEVEGLTTGNIATISSVSTISPPASPDWDEQAFSTVRGWPGVIEFHSQRLWLGGSSSLPAHIFGSRVAAFFNFDVGDAFPADSIQAAIAGEQINTITHIVSGRHLQVFTDHREFYAPHSEDRPLTPETFDLLPQTRYGTKRILEPEVFDESTIFVQAHGKAAREMIWRNDLRGYSADAISLISEDAIDDVQDIQVLYGGYDRPEQMAFFVNGDGSIGWYHAARAEQIRQWGRWTTDGTYHNLAVVDDKLYAVVERTQDATQINFLEVFELDYNLDCAVQSTSGSPQSVWSEPHPAFVNSHELSVTAENNALYLGEFTNGPDGVGGFEIDLGNIEVSQIEAGFNFTQTLEPMPIEVRDPQGISGGMPKRLVCVNVYMASSLALQVNGNRFFTAYDIQDDLSQAPSVFTGSKKYYLLGYSERPTWTITNDIPLACEVLAVSAEVEY